MSKDPILIFISFHFPPSERPAVRRNFGFYQALRPHFSDAYIITTSGGQNDEIVKNDFKINKENLIHLDNNDLALLFKKNEEEIISDDWRKGFVKRIIKLRNTYPVAFYFGKGNHKYVGRLKKEIEKIINSHPNENFVIYSSFSPFGDHIASSELRQKFPTRVKWIADFRDLFNDQYYKMYYWPNYRKKILRKYVNRADLVTTVSNEFQKSMTKELDSEILTTYNGVILNGKNRKPHNKFRISYTGSLMLGKRDPSPIFQALRENLDRGNFSTNDFVLSYAGQDGNIFLEFAKQFNLENNVENLGVLPQQEVNNLLSNSHFSLLLTSSADDYKGVLTSKFFVYLENSVPIINIINGSNDLEFEQIFEETGCGVIYYTEDPEYLDLTDFINQEINNFILNPQYLPKIKNKEAVTQLFSWESGVEKILKHLNV